MTGAGGRPPCCAAQAAGGWEVWRPWSRTDIALSDAAGNPTVNLKTQMESLARRYSDIAKLETIGHSINGEPIYAMKVTKGARKHKDGKRPAVLYSAVQHAREWLAGETERRTLRLFLDNYGRNGTAIGTDGKPVEGVSSRELTKLVDTRELWFILIANPDGYDFTFTPENRLWRKNLRDNDGDGQITASTASTRTGTSRPAGRTTTRARTANSRPRPTTAPGRPQSRRRRRSCR